MDNGRKWSTSDKQRKHIEQLPKSREKKGINEIEMIGKTVTQAIIEIKIATIIAKLNDVLLDIEEIETLKKEAKQNEKNPNYSIYGVGIKRLR